MYAIVIITIAMLIAPIMDGIAKWLASDYSSIQITWLRFVVHFLIFLPLVLVRHGLIGFLQTHWPSQLLRGTFLCLGVGSMFLALRYIPIAETLGIFFISPLIVTSLAPFILKESVGIKQMLCVAAGFVGAVLVIQPGYENFHWGYLLPVAGGFCFAGYLLISRKMAGQAPVMVTHALSGLVGVLLLAGFIPWVWKTPVNGTDWLLFLALGIVGAVSHGLVLLAYSRAKASLLAPFAYVEIITGTALGYVLFGDFPNTMAWAGILVIALSGMVVVYRRG